MNQADVVWILLLVTAFLTLVNLILVNMNLKTYTTMMRCCKPRTKKEVKERAEEGGDGD